MVRMPVFRPALQVSENLCKYISTIIKWVEIHNEYGDNTQSNHSSLVHNKIRFVLIIVKPFFFASWENFCKWRGGKIEGHTPLHVKQTLQWGGT